MLVSSWWVGQAACGGGLLALSLRELFNNLHLQTSRMSHHPGLLEATEIPFFCLILSFLSLAVSQYQLFLRSPDSARRQTNEQVLPRASGNTFFSNGEHTSRSEARHQLKQAVCSLTDKQQNRF